MLKIDRILIASLVATISLNACKKVTVGQYKGEGAGAGAEAAAGANSPGAMKGGESLALLAESESAADEQTAAEDEAGGAATEEGEVPEGEQGLSERFNMVKWIKTRPKMEPFYKYIDQGNTMFWMGDQSKFRIETNGTLGVSPDFEKGTEERKLGGKYWLKAYAFNQHLKPKDDELGLFVDIGVNATLDKLSMEMWFRITGQDIAARSILAGFDQTVMREKGVSVSAIPGVSGDVAMGGEIGLRTEFGVRRDNVLNLIYRPKASIHAAASLDVGLKGIATTGIQGSLRVADILMKGSANLGYNEPSKLLYFDFGLDPGEFKLLEGRIFFVPVKVFGIGLGDIDIWKPDPVGILKTPGYSTAFIKFLDEPKDSAACKSAVGSAGTMLAGSIKEIKAYITEAPEEDKAMMKNAMARSGMVYRKVQKFCSAQ